MDKLGPHAFNYVFLGYFNSKKGYKCFHPPTSKYHISIDIQFCKVESYFSRNVSLVPLQGKISSNKEED